MNRIKFVVSSRLPDPGKIGVFQPIKIGDLHFHHYSYMMNLLDRSWVYFGGYLNGFWVPGMDQAYYDDDPEVITKLWKEAQNFP